MRKYLLLSTMLTPLTGCVLTNGVTDTKISLEQGKEISRVSVSGENTSIYHSKMYNYKTGESRESTVIPTQLIDSVEDEAEIEMIKNIIGE